jgi:D-sedoheptulose 7-phosphate isomerase
LPDNESELKSSIETRKRLLDWFLDRGGPDVRRAADEITESLRRGGAVFTCGNGGSASQAEHFAAELAGRYKLDRKSLPVFALSTNTASVTAIANDFGFSEMFARQIEGIGKEGDCLVALSTSGNSINVVRACKVARAKKMKVLGFTGRTGGAMAGECDAVVRIPETDTARIQEMHMVVIHLICQHVEESLFAQQQAKSQQT